MTFDLPAIRAQFPALSRPAIFLDNPAGTQVAQHVVERMSEYLVRTNANHDGAFATSRESDASIEQARGAAADFLNAESPEQIVFGPNMTSLTFTISRALARTFNPGDAIVVTRLDHDANITPWVMAAEDRGCRIRWVDFHPEDGTLDMEDMQAAIVEGPRLVAVGYASNALGTINPVEKIISMAHAAGALVYIDAVQYAPHGPIDVQSLGCDFLVCSSYKFFGPHMGVLYGRHDLLDQLTAYKVRPAPAEPPGKFETGTGNFEGMAGGVGAIDYLEWLWLTLGKDSNGNDADTYTRRPPEPLDLLHRVVVPRADAHHAAAVFQPQALGDCQGIVIAVPDVDLVLIQLLRHPARRSAFEREADRGHALFQAAYIPQAVNGDPRGFF